MQKYNVLTLDDDPNFSAILHLTLDPKNFKVITTETTAEFLKAYTAQKWDFCLIDLNLNEGDDAGIKLIEHLRKNLLSITPLIVLSRNDRPEKIAQAIESGADDYISKPLDISMILSKIRFLLKGDFVHRNDLILGTAIVPSPLRNSSISFKLNPLKINEDGLYLRSSSFVSKGSLLDIEGHFIYEIFGKEKIRLSVTQNLRESTDSYSLFFEFPEEKPEFSKKAKDWLLYKLGKVL